MTACQYGFADIARLLLQKGANKWHVARTRGKEVTPLEVRAQGALRDRLPPQRQGQVRVRV